MSGATETAEAMETPTIVVRPFRHSTDEALIFATWLRAYRQSELARRMRNDDYFELQHRAIEGCLKRSTVLVAHLADDENTILGYLVFETYRDEPLLHFLYVKGPWRQLGVAKVLLKMAAINPNRLRFTHRTPNGDALWSKHPNARYVPHHFFGSAK